MPPDGGIEPITGPDQAGFGLRWRNAFYRVIEETSVSDALREYADGAHLTEWTGHLTTSVIRSCELLGLKAAGKGHPLDLLPQSGQEYLGLDATAFLPESAEMPSWPYPIMAFELENSRSDDRVAYSLWKVASVRTALGVVFAYRKTWDEAIALVDRMAKAVPEAYGPGVPWSVPSGSQIILAMGSRSDSEAFPWGYFKFWSYDRNVRRFEKL
ncbi:MAG: hypothetical protein CMJ35_08310 [Phycisphaerae bacterium]|jgi:hypothetical protein|nr:hypothetical protein [Phycisphaerae bacterium]MBM91600.1 hypothetical protein [Phycisphaerae bacterium]